MFDNRWDNWAGDFAESFGAGLLDPSIRNHVPEVLAQFGTSVRTIDPAFPDDVQPGTFAAVLSKVMPRLKLPDSAKAHVPEVVARFLEYLQESGRVGEGSEWADQVRSIGQAVLAGKKVESGVKGVTIRKVGTAPSVGRNDPCPCGSGKKYKKCCHSLG